MSLLGIHLTLMLGPAVPVLAPAQLVEALRSAEVTQSAQGRSGFQLTFGAGRAGPGELVDYPALIAPLLRPFNRVILIVTLNATPWVLMDGVILHQQLSPSSHPGRTTLTVTGEDVSAMMDLTETHHEHPAQPEPLIVSQLLLKYSQYGLISQIIPPATMEVPLPVERVPVFRGTDYAYLQEMARRYGHIFYIKPGPVPLTNIAYWGPPERGAPQRPLSVNVGPDTNVESVHFTYDALRPTLVEGSANVAGADMPLRTFASTRLPPLALFPAPLLTQPSVRTRLLDVPSGMSYVRAFAEAQAMTNSTTDQVVTATGELDALRYGGALQARGTVGLRGAGFSYDGFYYVDRVTHTIRQGQYKQRFRLTRDGLGALTPGLPP
ncbi:MAG TPA: hypothetical protein VGX50_06600 [Longimicrobium sp.]|nr:hypothetical protein [Longimicrobium sp.]